MSSAISQYKIKKTKRLLEEYENLFPDKTANIITNTLTGRGEHSPADIRQLLDSELQAGGSASNSKTAETRYHLREWKTLCEHLSEAPVSHTELRKYHPSHTPDNTEPSNTKILATGTLSAYQLSDAEYATLVCQAPPGDNDGEITGLKIVFTGSPAAFFKRTLAPNNWYRPKDV